MVDEDDADLSDSKPHAMTQEEKYQQVQEQHQVQEEEAEQQQQVHQDRGNEDDNEDGWEMHFQALVTFKRRYGHCDVQQQQEQGQQQRQEEDPEMAVLAQWVQHQRHLYKLKMEGKLVMVPRTPPTAAAAAPPPADVAAVAVARADQDDDVDHPTNNNNDIIIMNLHQLTEEREKKLTDLGFVWKFDQACWYAYYCQLYEFHKIHGHCNVPANYAPNKNLHVWCKLQRRQYKRAIIAKRKQRALLCKLKRTFQRQQQLQQQQRPMEGDDGEQHSSATTTTTQQQQQRQQMLLPLLTAVTTSTTPATNYITLLRMSKLNELGFCWNPRNIR